MSEEDSQKSEEKKVQEKKTLQGEYAAEKAVKADTPKVKRPSTPDPSEES